MKSGKLVLVLAILLLSAPGFACSVGMYGSLVSYSTDWYSQSLQDLAYQDLGAGWMASARTLVDCEYVDIVWAAAPPLDGYEFSPFEWLGEVWVQVSVWDTGYRECNWVYDPYTNTLTCYIDYPIFAAAGMEAFVIDPVTLEADAGFIGLVHYVDYSWTW